MKTVYLLLFLLALTCCNNHTPSTTVFTGNVMTIDYRIIVGRQLNKEHTLEIENLISQTFVEVNDIYNKWNPYSEISRLNQLSAGIKTPLSPQLESFLQKIQLLYEMTDGRFDPTIEPLQQLWKQNLLQGKLPQQSEIDAVVPAIGWDKIHVQDGFFFKDHDLTSLDFGGVAKGYCVDLLVERLNENGYPDVFVEWGGEIRASGKHPDNRPWTIFISRFGNKDPEQALAHLELKDQAVATSGDYMQNWVVDGVVYFHVIDPRTLRPRVATKDSVASASIVASSCMTADALATAAMTFDTVEEASSWLGELEVIELKECVLSRSVGTSFF